MFSPLLLFFCKFFPLTLSGFTFLFLFSMSSLICCLVVEWSGFDGLCSIHMYIKFVCLSTNCQKAKKIMKYVCQNAAGLSHTLQSNVVHCIRFIEFVSALELHVFSSCCFSDISDKRWFCLSLCWSIVLLLVGSRLSTEILDFDECFLCELRRYLENAQNIEHIFQFRYVAVWVSL